MKFIPVSIRVSLPIYKNARRNGGGFHLEEVDEPADNWERQLHHLLHHFLAAAPPPPADEEEEVEDSVPLR